ncbi:hypothetical protein R6G85_01885 [Actinotignum urinale]|uniref:hypothetical protein n=1 Tax=Actinotignum urinale TaxID=190146 RepID=UPI002A80FFC1|nr:hypothetical protein [Actinotignum urinale]MDY5128494.1 hypothetical protein [Actinotignum urinale]MDY5151238.1 hypothetical protein [Actinotignum urinale]
MSTPMNSLNATRTVRNNHVRNNHVRNPHGLQQVYPCQCARKLTMLFHMCAESASLFHICAKSASLPHMLSVADAMATRAGHVITREITEDSNDYGTVP